MDANFAPCLEVVLANEGGFVDDPRDPGGATNYGITLKTLTAWRHAPQTAADVRHLRLADVAPIYRAFYWGPARCALLVQGVDLMVFDEAVNEGPATAVAHLQRALGVAVDGQVGLVTLSALKTRRASDLVRQLAAVREAYYDALPGFAAFGRGWLARVGRTESAALRMTGAHTEP